MYFIEMSCTGTDHTWSNSLLEATDTNTNNEIIEREEPSDEVDSWVHLLNQDQWDVQDELRPLRQDMESSLEFVRINQLLPYVHTVYYCCMYWLVLAFCWLSTLVKVVEYVRL